MKQKSCCFTGHRPSKLPWGYDTKSDDFLHFYIALADAIEKKIEEGCTVFYTGMAEGVDFWSAQIVLQFKETHPEAKIQLIAVCPYIGQSHAWSKKNRWEYIEILNQADKVITLSDAYTPTCFYERNRYMVERCGHMIAGYDGKTPGGTKITFELAKKNGLDIVVVSPLGCTCALLYDCFKG